MNYYKWNFHSKAWCKMASQPKDSYARYRIRCRTCDLDTTKSYPMGSGDEKRKIMYPNENKERRKQGKERIKERWENKYKIK